MPGPRPWEMELIFYFGVVFLLVSDALIAGNDTYMNMGKGERKIMRKGKLLYRKKGNALKEIELDMDRKYLEER